MKYLTYYYITIVEKKNKGLTSLNNLKEEASRPSPAGMELCCLRSRKYSSFCYFRCSCP